MSCLLQRLRLPTVTTIVAPYAYDWKEITSFIMKTHNLEISGGLGPSVGLVGENDDRVPICIIQTHLFLPVCFTLDVFVVFQVLRVGLMGCNSSRENVDMVLAALKDALKHCHKSKV